MSATSFWISSPETGLISSAGSIPHRRPPRPGKNLQTIIGSGTGGGTDLWGRVVARHIGKHLPGTPTVVPQNMSGCSRIHRPR
jgi:hypothetical protein